MSLNRHLISIIIPCYNDADFVEQAVNSALNQTWSNTEIIIIDDGSENRTKKVLKRIQPKIDLLIVQDNNGQSSARNKGIMAAQGELIIVLDSDDYFEPSFAEKATDVITKKNEVKMVTCWGKKITESGVLISVFKPGGGDISKFVLQNGSFGSCMFRKSDWEVVGGYDESMKQGFEDWEFYIRLLSKGGVATVIPEILFNYRIRENSTTTRANNIKYDLHRIIIKKNIVLFQKFHLEHSNYLIGRIALEEREKYKVFVSLEYRLGHLILRPLRKIKFLFKRVLEQKK